MAMTDKDYDELEQLDPEERARLLSRKEEFVLNNKHLSDICNTLFDDSDESTLKLGRILRDLVAFNVDGTTDLIDNGDKNDRVDRYARVSLYDDSKRYIDNWLLTSLHRAQNRRGKTKASAEEEQTQETDTGQPTQGDVIEYAQVLADQYNAPPGRMEMLARKWHEEHTQSHWRDDKGNPIKNWRDYFDSYLKTLWQAGKLQDL